MAVLNLSVRGITQTTRNLNRAAARVSPRLVTQVERETIRLERDLKQHSLTGNKGFHPFWGVTGASGETLGARSGHTRRSIARRVFTVAGTVIGAVGSPLRQMKLHEEGGTVSGKPYLRIPTRAMQTAAGVDRNAGRSIKGQPGMFLLRSKAGNLWAAMRQGGTLVLAYLFKFQIRLRARHMFRAAKRRNEPGILARMRAVTASIAVDANGGR